MHQRRERRLADIRDLLIERPRTRLELCELLAKNHKGVSERNILQDIKHLKTHGVNGMPINIDFYKGHYRIIGSSGQHYSEMGYGEQAALLLALENLNPFSTLPKIKDVIDYCHTKLGAPHRQDSYLEIKHRGGYALTPEKPLFNKIKVIHEAVQSNKSIVFNYILVDVPRETERSTTLEVFPLRLVQWNGRFYLFAIPVEKAKKNGFIQENIRNYPLDAFASRAECGTHSFNWKKQTEILAMSSYLDDVIGVYKMSNQAREHVQCIFEKWAISHIKASPLHPSQKVSQIPGTNKHLVSWFVQRTVELENEIRKYGGAVLEVSKN